MIHYLDSEMAYTACFKLLDDGIHRVRTTDDVDKVTCPDCTEKILAEWEAES